METLSLTRAQRRTGGTRRASAFFTLSLFTLFAVGAPAGALDGPFVGVDLGASKPVNKNYRAHVSNGATANPYIGYMFNKFLGVQGRIHFVFQEPDNDQRGFPKENQTTTLLGGTVGPRLSVPLDENLEFYGTCEGGVFTGLSGRLTHTAPGLSAGGGLDYYVTPHVAVGLFGRWNRAYMSPHPTILVGQLAEQQGPADITWATGGISMTYRFNGPTVAPPPPPPPPAKVAEAPPPPAPEKKRIVLRAVHFDYDKANIRPDAVPILDEAVQVLKEAGTVAVIVEGHTDSIGSVAYNLKLSKRRAEAVRRYLVDHGTDSSRITSEGYGKSRPVASNDTAEGRQENRRVELHVD